MGVKVAAKAFREEEKYECRRRERRTTEARGRESAGASPGLHEIGEKDERMGKGVGCTLTRIRKKC